MTSYIRGVIMSFIMFTTRFGIFLTVLVFAGAAPRVPVETVFFLTCYYNIIKQTMTLYFPQGVGQIAEMNVAVQRIRDYLMSEECHFAPKKFAQTGLPDPIKKHVTIVDIPKDKVMVKFEGASSSWIKSSNQYDAEDINLQVALIFGVTGACSGQELLNITIDDIQCKTLLPAKLSLNLRRKILKSTEQIRISVPSKNITLTL